MLTKKQHVQIFIDGGITLQEQVYSELKRLNIGEISGIIRTGKFIAIVKLINLTNIELNEELREKIEKE